jgi:pimeloyl-ACP methyl ester carboxylesterase
MNPEALADALIRPRRLLGEGPRPAARLARNGLDLALHFRGSESSSRRALLVHGWETDHRDLETMAEALVGLGFRCVLPDLPAHGGSAGETMMIPEAAHALSEVDTTYGPFDVCVAHSMGSAVVLVGITRGLQIGKGAFLAPPANYVHQLSRSARAAGAPQPMVTGALAVLRSRCPDIDGIDSEKLAHHLTMEGLVVAAGDDQILDPQDARLLAAAWPGSSLLDLPKASHRAVLRDATTVNAVCRLVDDREAFESNETGSSSPAS